MKLKQTKFEMSNFEAQTKLSEQLMLVQFVETARTGDEALLITVSHTTLNEVFLHFMKLKSSTCQKFGVCQIKGDGNQMMTPTASLFNQVKLHSSQNLLLFQSTSEPKLTVLNVQTFIDTGEPMIELCADVPVYEDFIFGFCQDFPCYFSAMQSTLVCMVPTKKGIKPVDMMVG